MDDFVFEKSTKISKSNFPRQKIILYHSIPLISGRTRKIGKVDIALKPPMASMQMVLVSSCAALRVSE
jgi:hypothetical protein